VLPNETAHAALQVELFSRSAVGIAQWDGYVRTHPQGTVFHLTAWQRLIESSFGHKPQHLVAKKAETGEVVGLLPLFLLRSRIFGRLLVSTPQAAYGGVLSDTAATSDALLAYAWKIARENNVEFTELRNFENAIDDPALARKDLYVTFRQQLYQDPEKNYLAIPRKTRAEIREGIRNGLEFQVNAISANEFFDVYSRSVRHLGTPVFPRCLFSNGLREFGSDCKIFSVHWNGKLVSAVWTLFYRGQIVPHYGGAIREYNRLAVNNFMYWMLIKYGCENGYHLFDFGRSKKGTGSFDFKKRWGMTMTALPYQYYLVRQKSLPDTSPLNPKFSLAIRIWRQLPLWFTNSVGPIVSRHLT
jgi:FemAB-related protein (PEP-CTERM system-associated)